MIDVIIPTYNRAGSLRKVINSYMVQPELVTCIIVDDCSTDDTASWATELAQQYPGKVLYHRVDVKTTLPDLRNIGVSLAKSEYIFMGEDDVILPPDHFQVLLQKIQEYNAAIIAGRRVYLYEGESLTEAITRANQDRGPVFTRIPFEGYFERYIDTPQQVPFIHSNALMRRDVFAAVQYDPKYDGNAFREESDFYIRATDRGFSIWLIPDTISFHLKNATVNARGGSRKNRLIYEYHVWKNTIRFFRKNKYILKRIYGINHSMAFALVCLIARYTYAAQRRVHWHLSHHGTT